MAIVEDGYSITDEEAALAFSSPESRELVGPAGPGSDILTQDGVISAQRVGVKRDLPQIMQDLKILAAMAGENWVYSWPVRNKDGSETIISGASIKLANDLSRTYGNCQVDVRAFDQGKSWLFYARFVDIETGYSLTRAFEQRKDQQSIKTKDAGRAENIAFQIGQSKAIRNVIVNALQTHADFCVEEANRNLVEKIGQKIEFYREKLQERCKDMGIELKHVETRVGRVIAEWTARDMARVIAEFQAVNDGMANAIDLYPDPDAPERPIRGHKPKTESKVDAGYKLAYPDGSVTPGLDAAAFLVELDELLDGTEDAEVKSQIMTANEDAVEMAEAETSKGKTETTNEINTDDATSEATAKDQEKSAQ